MLVIFLSLPIEICLTPQTSIEKVCFKVASGSGMFDSTMTKSKYYITISHNFLQTGAEVVLIAVAQVVIDVIDVITK